MSVSLAYRMDDRTKDVFAANIEQDTEKQRVWMPIIQVEFAARNMPIDYVDSGVDNSGALIEGALPNHDLDYVITFILSQKSCPLDIKTIDEKYQGFFTFKIFDLKKSIERNGVFMIPRKDCYYIFSMKAQEIMLNRLEHKIYPGFSTEKEAVRIPQWKQEPGRTSYEELISEGLVRREAWSSEANKLIEENAVILFAERTK